MVNKYEPRPIDTASVELDGQLLELTEHLARHAHDVWALQRLSDGWTWGASRSDSAKTHPCLIPYEQLPESEKVYDRKTALETIKAVIAIGYRITSISTERE
jgi:RyR domain